MKVIGIVGSPRKNGLTNRLVEAALRGASSQPDVEIEKVYLIDYDIKPYTGEGSSCPEELNVKCEESAAIVLGAPIYWGDINGLTKDFMDTVRIENANGKYALGICIAGGTGKGLLSGIQSIYHFFYHRQMKGIDPTPVSRFNFDESLKSLYESGKKLVKLCREKPYRFENLTDRIEYYESLPYMKRSFIDEIYMLAGQLIEISKSEKVEEARRLYLKAKSLLEQDRTIEAVKYVVEVYDMLYFQ